MATFVKTSGRLDIIKADPSDNTLLECAMTANADYVVSGDKRHVIPVKRLGRIRVITAGEVLELLR